MYKKFLLLILFFINLNSVDQYYCTASDNRYFGMLLNLIGSIHYSNYDTLNEIAVFNLGMTNEQLNLLKTIDKVTVHEIELTNPDLLKPFKTHLKGKTVPGWYAWKPVILKQALDMFPYVLWIDAGLAVLRPMNELFEYIKNNGYFLCTGGDKIENNRYAHPVKWQTTKLLIDKFKLNSSERKWILEQEALLGGFVGVNQQNINKFVNQLYEFTKNLKMFEDDGSSAGGFGCGRHDQAILTIIAYLNGLKIHRQPTNQEDPILLTVNKQHFPFFLQWDPQKLNQNTHVYVSARFDPRTNFVFKNFIKTGSPKNNEKKLNFIFPKDFVWSLSTQFLILLKKIFKPTVFIETGTLVGNTCEKAKSIFEKVYSIELDQNLYNFASNRFKNNNNVHIKFGDSKKILKEILSELKTEKILFFLDAHWSIDIGAKGEENTPILSELKAIKESNIKDAVIVIDDIRFFQPQNLVEKYIKNASHDPSSTGFPSLEELQTIIFDINSNYKFIIYGDMAIAYTDDIKITPIIEAMTSNKISKNDSDILEHINTFANCNNVEKESIEALLKIKDPELFTTHYKLWNILILFNEGKIEEAKKMLNELKQLGFINLHLTHYLKVIENKYSM